MGPKAKASPRPEAPGRRHAVPGWRLRLPHLSLYVLRELLGPVALLTLLMTGVIWLINILPLLDLVINRGQSAPTFLYLSLLLLPTLLMLILPMAFFFATLFTLSRLAGDSELVVMASAGYSVRQLMLPILACATIVMVITYACALVLMPAGQRALRDKVMDIRADVAGALLNEGEFNPAAPGLTVFIRRISSNGEISGVLVHDNRDRKHPVTYIAQKGLLAQTPLGTRLIMDNGTIEQSSQNGKQLSVLHFQRDTINLDQFAGPTHATLRKMQERYLNELFWPPESGLSQRVRNQFFAEAHNRISQPLYCIVFALIALAAVIRGRRQRGKVALRLGMASVAAAGLRIAGYGVMGAAQNNPPLVILFYLLPLLGACGAIAVLAGYSPTAVLARFRLPAHTGDAAA